MKVYETNDIRNVGLIGHGHSGKTSLAAALLFTTGATNRLTREIGRASCRERV